jgi:superfamily II DNA or RNA helicase
MFELRDYQLEAVNSVFGHWQENAATLIVAATGCGKTVLMCEIIRRVFPRRVMILAHREELIYQARDKVQRFAGVNADIEMGELRANEDAGLFGKPRVVVSTIQTQTAGGDGMGRMGRFDPWEFEFLIVDEAHHATADSYRRVLDYYRQNENLRVLGVTATTRRPWARSSIPSPTSTRSWTRSVTATWSRSGSSS